MANETSEIQDEAITDETENAGEFAVLRSRVDAKLVGLRDCKYRDGADGKLRNLTQTKVNYRVLDWIITNNEDVVHQAAVYVEENAEERLTEQQKLAVTINEFTPEQLAQFKTFLAQIDS